MKKILISAICLLSTFTMAYSMNTKGLGLRLNVGSHVNFDGDNTERNKGNFKLGLQTDLSLPVYQIDARTGLEFAPGIDVDLTFGKKTVSDAESVALDIYIVPNIALLGTYELQNEAMLKAGVKAGLGLAHYNGSPKGTFKIGPEFIIDYKNVTINTELGGQGIFDKDKSFGVFYFGVGAGYRF